MRLFSKKPKCPYCEFELDKKPTRKKKCPNCSEFILPGRLGTQAIQKMLKKYLSSSFLVIILLPLLLPSSGIAPQEVIIKCYQYNPPPNEDWVECSSSNSQLWYQLFFYIYVKPDDVDLPITWTVTTPYDPPFPPIPPSPTPEPLWKEVGGPSLSFRLFCMKDETYEMVVTAENDYGSATNSYTVECRGGEVSTFLFFPTIVHLHSQ